MNMSAIFHIFNKNISRINLSRTDVDKFRIIEFDEFRPLLVGYDYTLINETFIPVFNKLDKTQVKFHPVKITRLLTGEVWSNYYELKIINKITPENIHRLDSVGDKVWQFDNNLFASESIKDDLFRLSNGELDNSIGFSHFG